jgi:hypothetical protein
VTGLERDVAGTGGGELRPLAEQVKAQALAVYNACRDLSEGEHAETVLGGERRKRALTMEEILAMKVQSGGRGGRGGSAAAAAAATAGDVAMPAPVPVAELLQPQLRPQQPRVQPQQPRVPAAAVVAAPPPQPQHQPPLVQPAVAQAAPVSAGRSWSAALTGRASHAAAPSMPVYTGMVPAAPVYAPMAAAPMLPMGAIPVPTDQAPMPGLPVDMPPLPHAAPPPAAAVQPAADHAPNAALAAAEVAERLRQSFPAAPAGAGPAARGGRRPGGRTGGRAARA